MTDHGVAKRREGEHEWLVKPRVVVVCCCTCEKPFPTIADFPMNGKKEQLVWCPDKHANVLELNAQDADSHELIPEEDEDLIKPEWWRKLICKGSGGGYHTRVLMWTDGLYCLDCGYFMPKEEYMARMYSGGF